jgi:hypothetical protein
MPAKQSGADEWRDRRAKHLAKLGCALLFGNVYLPRYKQTRKVILNVINRVSVPCSFFGVGIEFFVLLLSLPTLETDVPGNEQREETFQSGARADGGSVYDFS